MGARGITSLAIVLAIGVFWTQGVEGWSRPVAWASQHSESAPSSHKLLLEVEGRKVFFSPTGFSVGEPFLSRFHQLGAVTALGYPISRPYEQDGALHQAFQRGIMRWDRSSGRIELVDLVDQFHEKGLDDHLYGSGIPRYALRDFPRTPSGQWQMLTQPQIRLFYWNSPDPLSLFGLPTSPPEKYGPFIAQRFQKGVLQLWVESIPGMPPKGTVVGALVGNLAKELGFIPAEALKEEAPPQESTPAAVISHNRSQPTRVAITIDDAWSPSLVRDVLEMGKKYEVKFTFFPVGWVFSAQAEIWREAIAQGHEVGNHTFAHPRLGELSDTEIKQEIKLANQALDKALGYHYAMKYFRPPGGARDVRVAKIAQEEGLTAVVWSVDPSKAPSTYEHIVSRVQGGDIILLHFCQKDIGDLPRIIEYLQKKGFTLTTVSGLLAN